MVAGISSAWIVPTLLTKVEVLQNFAHAHSLNLDVSISFGIVFVLSLVGCFAGTWLRAPEDEEVLKDFYRRVRPWGFWEPILEKVQQDDPSFQRNTDFFRDMFNVVVGMIWQLALIVVPMYVVTWRLGRAAIALAVVASTSLILKFTWYDHSKELEHINQYERAAVLVPEANLTAK
jgi:solute:Na+ symporter, SSS family